MLCAFANNNDLRNCLAAINTALNSDLSDVLVFRAKLRPHAVTDGWVDEIENNSQPTESQEEESLYGFSVKSSDKVRVIRDWRGMPELRKHFPSINSEIINDVWKQQQCWQACFDVLGSLVRSHGSIIIEQCDLVLDDIHFPALSLSSGPLSNSHEINSHHSSRSGSQDWTIVSLEQSFSNMSVNSASTNDNQEIETWEIVPSPFSSKNASVFSYKDALMKPVSKAMLHADEVPKKRTWEDLALEQSQRGWKPIYVIAKVPNIRPDREYVNTGICDLDEEEAGEIINLSFIHLVIIIFCIHRHVLGPMYQC